MHISCTQSKKMRKKIILSELIQNISLTDMFLSFQDFDHIVLLNSNFYGKNEVQGNFYSHYDFIFGFGEINTCQAVQQNNFQHLKLFYDDLKDWLFGYFSYDLKNEIEKMSSKHFDGIGMPELYFFQPEIVIHSVNNIVTLEYFPYYTLESRIENILNRLAAGENKREKVQLQQIDVKTRISKEQYLEKIEMIQKYIHRGDIYEATFCQEFYSENVDIEPQQMYLKLNSLSPMPFSAFLKIGDKYLISASPERFLMKTKNVLLSQPMKGTAQRGKNSDEDALIKHKLSIDPKERSENVMIVDLVRNDLSHSAASGSVEVSELYGVYEFPGVFQMVSTVKSLLDTGFHFIDALKNAFPPGSMTGAPKIRAMEIIEDIESTKRGAFSGSFGYLSPEGDFDFNVIIRSILYNKKTQYLSFITGGAITANSIAENEYQESLLKAKAIFEALRL